MDHQALIIVRRAPGDRCLPLVQEPGLRQFVLPHCTGGWDLQRVRTFRRFFGHAQLEAYRPRRKHRVIMGLIKELHATLEDQGWEDGWLDAFRDLTETQVT